MVHILADTCKGCGYCIKFCPKQVLEIGTVRNKKGSFYPYVTDESKCISCGICSTMCPDAAIEIYEEEKA